MRIGNASDGRMLGGFEGGLGGFCLCSENVYIACSGVRFWRCVFINTLDRGMGSLFFNCGSSIVVVG